LEPDETVTVFTGKAELGQGILTALAQIAAEGLDVGFDKVRMISADTLRGPDEQYTFGSQSVEQSGSAIGAASAQGPIVPRLSSVQFRGVTDAMPNTWKTAISAKPH
jgi:CO/xanthine dehydrogenase Mo-binding subunit